MITNYYIKELFIYPIKSLAGIAVSSARAEEMGFENDRRWMLIDSENQFITQRVYPILSQFYPKISGDKIEIKHLDKIHEFIINETLDKAISSKVWDDESRVFEVNKETSAWFSDCLGFACKLVKISKKGARTHFSSKLEQTMNVSLADAYPFLMIGSKSLDFLNEKLKEKISIQRFRPNLVVETFIAHEEDDFDTFSIGAVSFKNIKTCERCIMVNHDPKNGNVKKEPLKTLSTYRKVNNSVYFGTNIMCLNEGTISVGDEIKFG